MDLLQLLYISKKSYVKKKEKVETALKYVYKLLQIDEPNAPSIRNIALPVRAKIITS